MQSISGKESARSSSPSFVKFGSFVSAKTGTPFSCAAAAIVLTTSGSSNGARNSEPSTTAPASVIASAYRSGWKLYRCALFVIDLRLPSSATNIVVTGVG